MRPLSSRKIRPHSSASRSPSTSEFKLKFRDSGLTRPESAPSIKKYKTGIEKVETEERRMAEDV
jgi:hypothetical protein